MRSVVSFAVLRIIRAGEDAKDLPALAENLARCEQLAPGKPIILGIYLYDYGSNRPMPLDRLKPYQREAFDAAYAAAAARAMRPQVVLLLTAPREVLAERIAYRRRPASGSSDLFRDIGEAADRGNVEAFLGDLVGEQDRLVAELQGRRAAGVADVLADLPKAVVRIDTSDFGQAIDEAVAAVEAMG